MRISFLFGSLLFFLTLHFTSFSQVEKDSVPTKKVLITLVNGNERIGVILSDDGREVLLKTDDLGNIYIPKTDIVNIKPVEEVEFESVNGEVQRVGPFTTRYQFTTNALPIRKGEDYAMVNLFGPEVHFAVSDRLSLGVMSTWIASPLVLALKYSIPTNNENINFGFGTLLGSSGYIRQFSGYGGLHWLMMTVGQRTRNITFSAGYGYLTAGNRMRNLTVPGTYDVEKDEFGNSQHYFYLQNEAVDIGIPNGPVVSIAGITPIGKKASLIFDVMYLTNQSANAGRTRTYYNENGAEVFEWEGAEKLVVSAYDIRTHVIIVMPGMRFQQSDSRAFQVALAGVSVFGTDRNFSFPLPSASWFYTF